MSYQPSGGGGGERKDLLRGGKKKGKARQSTKLKKSSLKGVQDRAEKCEGDAEGIKDFREKRKKNASEEKG